MFHDMVFYIRGALLSGCSTVWVLYCQGVLPSGNMFKVYTIQGDLALGVRSLRGILPSGCSTFDVIDVQ